MFDFFWQIKDLVFSKTTKDTSVILAGNALASVFTIAFTVFAAKFLGPEKWAIVAAIISFLTILTAVGDFGLGAGLFRFVSKHWAEGEHEEAQKLLGIIFSLRFLSALFLGVCILILSPLLAPLVIKSTDPFLLIISTVGIVGSLLLDFQVTSFEAKRHWYQAAGFIFIVSLLRVILTFFIFYIKAVSVFNIVIIFSISPLLAFFISLFIERVNLVPYNKWGKTVKNVVTFSGWLGVNRIAGAISSRIDIFFLLHLINPTQVGIFAAARQLAQGVPIIIGSFATVLAPRFATYERNELKASFKKALMLSVFMSLGVIIGIALANPIMSLFGPKYAGSAGVFQWLLVGLLPFALSTPMTNIIIYSFHKPKIITILSLIQLPLIALGNLYFIPSMGVYGTVLVFGLWNLSTLIVTSIFSWYYMRRML